MVAKTPPAVRRTKTSGTAVAAAAAALNPNLVRETLSKVDKCMARLQELQCTVTGGRKVVAGVNLSPRSTRGYLKTSLRCKQESLRMRNSSARKSPSGKFPVSTKGEWKRMSLPAMLLGETVVEILQASQFAKEIVTAAAALSDAATATAVDPKTPVAVRRINRLPNEQSELKARRKKEKQCRTKTIRSENTPTTAARARSRIRFKSNSPVITRTENKSSGSVSRPSVRADRVSPRHRPWAKNTVLFPNPAFVTSSPPASCRKHTFYQTKSPVLVRTRTPTKSPPHKFVIKTPPSTLRSQFKSPVLVRTRTPTKSPPHKFVIKTPPSTLRSQFKSKTAVPAAAPTRSPPPVPKAAVAVAPRRRSFSPSKFVQRLVSPLRTRVSLQIKNSNGAGFMSGLKQRQGFVTPVRMSSGSRRQELMCH